MQIVADENIPFVKQAFESLGDITTYPGRTLTPAQVENAELLLVRSVTPVNRVLLENSRVRYVASATIGFDHIDTEYLASQGIGWCTAPGCNAISAAEYVIAALIEYQQRTGTILAGRELAIIGYGNVGQRVKPRAEALGLTCIINDPLRETWDTTESYVSLPRALNADIITLHTPLTHDGQHPTHHLLGAEELALLKANTLLINAARGGVVDNQALKQALQQQSLHAILDVWENEPALDTELLTHVLLGTPHIAGYSYDGRLRGTEMILQQCCAFFDIPTAWQTSDAFADGDPTISITPSDAADALYHAINTAYAITEDDCALRQACKHAFPEQQFDQLRKHYRQRREFAHYQLSASKTIAAKTIENLQFTLRTNC